MHIRKLALLTLAFSLISFVIFVLSVLIFKVAGAHYGSTTRVSVQAVTCAASFIAYLFLRRKFIKTKKIVCSFSLVRNICFWGTLGLVFSVIPYFFFLDSNPIKWENFRAELIFTAFIFSLNAAIFEEIYFRDILLRSMLPYFGKDIAIIAQIVFFSGVHFFWNRFTWLNVLSLSVAATLFSLLWLLTEDFFVPLIAHFVDDFSIMIFNGVFTTFVARAGLLIGETSVLQIVTKIIFELIIALAVWYLLRQKAAKVKPKTLRS